MEPETVRMLLMYVAGGGIGGAVGAVMGVWIGLKIEAKKKDKPSVGMDVAKNEDEVAYILDGKEVSKEEYDKWAQDQYNKKSDELEKTLKEQPVLPKKPKVKVKPVDYNAISKKNGSSKPDLTDLAKEKLGETATVELISNAKLMEEPHVISLEDYANEREEYKKITITYYKKDKKFADQNNDLLTNPERDLGVDAILHFGEESGDPDTVYIRNPKLETDYELIRLNASYDIEVLGYRDPETDKLKKPRNSRKTRKTDVDDENGEDD